MLWLNVACGANYLTNMFGIRNKRPTWMVLRLYRHPPTFTTAAPFSRQHFLPFESSSSAQWFWVSTEHRQVAQNKMQRRSTHPTTVQRNDWTYVLDTTFDRVRKRHLIYLFRMLLSKSTRLTASSNPGFMSPSPIVWGLLFSPIWIAIR